MEKEDIRKLEFRLNEIEVKLFWLDSAYSDDSLKLEIKELKKEKADIISKLREAEHEEK